MDARVIVSPFLNGGSSHVITGQPEGLSVLDHFVIPGNVVQGIVFIIPLAPPSIGVSQGGEVAAAVDMVELARVGYEYVTALLVLQPGTGSLNPSPAVSTVLLAPQPRPRQST